MRQTTPLWHIFSAGLSTKLLLDCLCFWDSPLLYWLHPRPSRSELPLPFSPVHCELCVAGTFVGLMYGHGVVTVSDWFERSLASQTLARTARATMFLVALGVAPYTANYLESLFAEAQIYGRSVSVAACVRVQRSSRFWRQRFGSRAGRTLRRVLGGSGVEPGDGELDNIPLAPLQGEEDVHVEWSCPADLDIPHDMLCPITRELFARPVLLHGVPFEEFALREWLARSSRHPLYVDVPIYPDELQPARELAELCTNFARQRGLVLRRRA